MTCCYDMEPSTVALLSIPSPLSAMTWNSTTSSTPNPLVAPLNPNPPHRYVMNSSTIGPLPDVTHSLAYLVPSRT